MIPSLVSSSSSRILRATPLPSAKIRDVPKLLPNRRLRLPQEEAKHRKLQPEKAPAHVENKDVKFRVTVTGKLETKINKKSR